MTQLRLDLPDYHSYYRPPEDALPKVDWKAPCLADLPSWASAKRVSVAAAGLNTDIHGSAEYRAHLVSVLASRAVTAAG